jgi:hypothetical protein
MPCCRLPDGQFALSRILESIQHWNQRAKCRRIRLEEIRFMVAASLRFRLVGDSLHVTQSE